MNKDDVDPNPRRLIAPAVKGMPTTQDRNFAVRLILKGRDSKQAIKELTAEQLVHFNDSQSHKSRLAEKFFRSLTAREIKSAIDQFSLTRNAEDRKDQSKLLAAYFCFCRSFGVTNTSDNQPILPLQADFALAISLRLCGIDDDEVYQRVIPKWESPDRAMGWAKASDVAKNRDLDIRNQAVGAFLELRRRERQTTSEAKRAAAARFGLGVEAVRQVSGSVKIAFSSFESDSDADLNEFIRFASQVIPKKVPPR